MTIIELINKSIYSMDINELSALLKYYENHTERYKYESKINSINRAIERVSRKVIEEESWIALAREDKATKEKWESYGAYFKNNSPYCIWYYNDIEFYRWVSGVHVSEEIYRLREADKKIMNLIEGA